jgi:muramidase (phage lysozyme)
MTSRADLRQALHHPNVRALLRVIREGESDQTPDAYRKLVGDPPGVYSLTDLADHPRRVVHIDRLGILSSAAGAYQFLTRTWDELVQQYGFENFGPMCQDEAAIALFVRRKALDAAIGGALALWLDKCSYEWASLPPGRYGQGELTIDRVVAVYTQYGGKWIHDEVDA